MNFKKVFSAIVAGLITSTLFSNLSFASENQSTQQSQSGPDRIVLIDKDTPKDKREKYGIKDENLNLDNEDDASTFFLLTDEFNTVYSYIETSPSGSRNIHLNNLRTAPKYRRKGYAKLLLMAVLNSFKNRKIYLEDICDACNHKNNICVYEKFGFVTVCESKTQRSMMLEKKDEDINYNGNTENLIKLDIIKL